jgi:16S rRNA (adenine1518-N6/adenine1519-N6)-dimethyltransferase
MSFTLHDPAVQSPAALLQAYEGHARKNFGQHFLSDPSILANICDVAGLQEGDQVLEIGPGCGPLTWTMLNRGAHVHAIELDRQLAAFLRDMFPLGEQFALTEADALKVDLGALLAQRPDMRWRVIANLPYNVATEVFFLLSEHTERIDTMALMFQREVALRMVATPADDVYGVLSLMTHLHWDASLAISLPPGAFRPPPKVHSGVVVFRPVAGSRIPDPALRKLFVRVVRAAFQQRRKQIHNGLRSLGYDRDAVAAALIAAGIPTTARPETLDFDAIVRLTTALASSAG